MEAKWIISSDGYYPYCSNCKGEPDRDFGDNTLPGVCPFCNATMTNGSEGKSKENK